MAGPYKSTTMQGNGTSHLLVQMTLHNTFNIRGFAQAAMAGYMPHCTEHALVLVPG